MRALLALILLSSSGLAVRAADFSIVTLPIDCRPNQTCWIANLVDQDSGPGARDPLCGQATYDGHKGIDFALRDLDAMEATVAVLAAAPGTVTGVRDEMADQDFRDHPAAAIQGRECGNGLVIDHGDGWTSQYCHMRRGSLAVKAGQRVTAGQALGAVGLSGKTMFPHLHFQLARESRIVDPMTGLGEGQACGTAATPLFSADLLGRIDYQASIVYQAAVLTASPTAEAILQGPKTAPTIARDAPALVIWTALFGARKDQSVEFEIFDPDGKRLFEHRSPIEKDQARRYEFAGKRKPEGRDWPPGSYLATIRYQRKKADDQIIRLPFEIR